MSFLSATNQRRLGIQAGLILLASVVVGFAYNALNPAGLRWKEPAPEPEAPAKELGVSSSAGRYHVETISARLISIRDSAVDAPGVGSGAAPLALRPPTSGAKSGTTAVRTSWATANVLVEQGEVVLVDSRQRFTFEAGHIPGAVNLPLKEVAKEIEKFAAAYPPPDTRLVVYCSNQSCSASSKLAALLTRDYGYREVQYVPGGYLEWLQAQGSERK
jgi:rhodanese-related sulfurtransferase